MIKNTNYDLEERTAVFSEILIKLCKVCPKNSVTIPILDQLIRSGTSIGANYLEANNASSKKDFTNKIFICKKESEETKYWLKILLSCYSSEEKSINVLYDECRQLNLIFQKIIATIKNNKMANN